MDPIKFYSRKDIQKAMLEIALNREVAIQFGDKGFGKRPDILQFEGDILELIKQGATSFHISEELWRDPLKLASGMTQTQLNSLRIGWDLLLDIDCKFLDFSKITALTLIEALKFHGVENISLKFSGGSGFHIAIPFSSFPEKINDTETKFLFPEGPKIIASYLKDIIKDPLSTNILEKNTTEEISKITNKPKEELLKKNIFEPYSILNLDTVLISSRHLFRAPYSFNEKTNLVSIPLKLSQLENFKLSQAKPENIESTIKFLKESDVKEASQLITQAFDFSAKTKKIEKTRTKVELPKYAIKEEYFPPCMRIGLNGLEDGRKRFLFSLINFLKNLGWSMEAIEDKVFEWNKKNPEPLRENYIVTQLNWHKRNKTILPPNCDNMNYYKGMLICYPDNLCKTIKNPVNYTIKKNKLFGIKRSYN